MSYVEKSLGADEELKYRFWFHWVINIFIYGFHLLMLGVVFYLWTIVDVISWNVFGIIAIVAFIPSGMYHLGIICTEHAATTKRVILKKGIIARYTQEQVLAKVETVEVNQTIIGRLLDYGDIKITGTGASALIYRLIDEPLEVKKKIEGLL